MTNDQTDRLLSLLERYVRVEETKLSLTVDQLRVRNAQEERSLAAQERLAEGKLTVQGAMTGELVQHHRVPVPEKTPA